MKVYIVSLGAGVLVGVIYSLLHVRSPAPPLVALVGLAGTQHIFGMLPGHHSAQQKYVVTKAVEK
jgi:XapX domain-containing protein